MWPLILAKQCCGTNSESMQSRSNEYRWFTQTPFAYFCPGFEVNHVAVIHFEKTFKTKYSPRGPCLPILDSELKIELILISIDLGFGVFLVLLTWLFISQDRRKYSAYFRKISENEMTRKNRDVVVGPMSIVPQPTLVIDDVDLPIQIIATKPPTKKHTYKGYLNGLNETQ